MKKTLLILFVAVASLTACKKDKEGKLEGRWDKTKEYSVEYENGVKTDEEAEAWEKGELYIVFKDNTYKVYREDGKDLVEEGTFTATDNSLTLKNGQETYTLKIRWNSKKELVIIDEETYTYDGKTYREVEEQTFQKN